MHATRPRNPRAHLVVLADEFARGIDLITDGLATVRATGACRRYEAGHEGRLEYLDPDRTGAETRADPAVRLGVSRRTPAPRAACPIVLSPARGCRRGHGIGDPEPQPGRHGPP